MHAKHADSARPNDLSGLVVGSMFAVLNALGARFLDKALEIALANATIERVVGGLSTTPKPSACFVGICLHLR